MPAYTPTTFVRLGRKKKAYTWAEHYQLLWNGWDVYGPSPAFPREDIPASLKDIDDASDVLDSGTICSAANMTGVSTAISTGATIIPGCIIVVPATTRDVWLEWGAAVGTSVGGQGAIYGIVYDLSNGGAVAVDSSLVYCGPNTPVTTQVGIDRGSTRVGPITSTKIYGLYGQVSREAATSLTAYYRNLNGAGRSFLTAVAR